MILNGNYIDDGNGNGNGNDMWSVSTSLNYKLDLLLLILGIFTTISATYIVASSYFEAFSSGKIDQC